MAIILSHPMTAQEIRVLQEYRRINSESMTLEAITAIKHPAGGGALPAASLVAKGYLAGNGAMYTLTGKGKEFIALDVKPEFESAAASDEPATDD